MRISRHAKYAAKAGGPLEGKAAAVRFIRANTKDVTLYLGSDQPRHDSEHLGKTVSESLITFSG